MSETVKVQELDNEDFFHALVWSYNEMIDQIKELMDLEKLPNNLLTRTSLKCHKTFIADFIKRYGEIKDVQFHF